MNDLQWIKLCVDLFDNPKIRNLDTLPKGDTYFRIWINLMVLAGKINNQGLVYFNQDRPHYVSRHSQSFPSVGYRPRTVGQRN